MKCLLSILAAVLVLGCDRVDVRVDVPRPLIVVWSSNPLSTVEEAKAPELVVYENGTVIARFHDAENMLQYRIGTIRDEQRVALLADAIAYFSSAEYHDHFEQARGSDYSTSAIVLHAGVRVVGTSIYGVGLWSVRSAAHTLDFDPEVTGLPSTLCRLLAQLHFVKELATEKWTRFQRDGSGIPLFPNHDALNAVGEAHIAAGSTNATKG